MLGFPGHRCCASAVGLLSQKNIRSRFSQHLCCGAAKTEPEERPGGRARGGDGRAPCLISAVNQRSNLHGFGPDRLQRVTEIGRHRETGARLCRLGQTEGLWWDRALPWPLSVFAVGLKALCFEALLSNLLRSGGAIMSSYHIVKPYKSVISHPL